MLSLLDLVMLIIGILFLGIWYLFYIKGMKYKELFVNLEDEDYPAKEIYGIGYAFADTLKLTFRGKKDKVLRKQIGILYEPKYVEYYIRVIYAQRITMALTVLCFAVPAYFALDSIVVFVMVIAAAAFVFFYYGGVVPQNVQKRSDEMLSDFSDVVSKLALLVNAGMILREAWEKVAYSGERTLYKEMQKSVVEMRNGISEIDALYLFGQRCTSQEIKKFSSTLIQGMVKGNSELALMLTEQSKEVWNLKMQQVRRKGELANSKLLIPIFIVFIGILIVVVVPIFSNLGV